MFDNIASLFQRRVNLDDRITALQAELSDIADIKTMLETDGWRILHQKLIDLIATFDKQIVELTGNLDKNKDEIIARRAIKTAYVGFLGIITNQISTEGEKRMKLRKTIEFQNETQEGTTQNG